MRLLRPGRNGPFATGDIIKALLGQAGKDFKVLGRGRGAALAAGRIVSYSLHAILGIGSYFGLYKASNRAHSTVPI